MRKLFILTTFICSLMMSSMAHAEWTKVTENDTGDSSYVDFERIRKHNGKVYFWRMSDYLKPTKRGVLSGKIYHEAECDQFRLRYLSGTFYKSPMGEGAINSSVNTPQKGWTYPPPESVFEVILKAVCNHNP